MGPERRRKGARRIGVGEREAGAKGGWQKEMMTMMMGGVQLDVFGERAFECPHRG